mmetsp:Transcript_16798/g.46111  ORF Transcript_16798/g.46111 Transcript_16798/m.46111 type:complete len:400 (+) Transcript_16798:542-1741(+)
MEATTATCSAAERTLTHTTVRDEILNYSQQHSNDFGIPDGSQRIPMKKLMKLFAIKKKSPMERQNRFRAIVNDLCDLEVIDDIGKILVLKDSEFFSSSRYLNCDDDGDGDLPTSRTRNGSVKETLTEKSDEFEYNQAELEYGDAAPTHAESNARNDVTNRDRDHDQNNNDHSTQRPARFRPPHHAHSVADMSVSTTDSVGVYPYRTPESNGTSNTSNNTNRNDHLDPSAELSRRIGYRRRGSVTRYSIVAHNTVQEEYKQHEEMIDQFRRDSLKIEKSMLNLSLKNIDPDLDDSDHEHNHEHNHEHEHEREDHPRDHSRNASRAAWSTSATASASSTNLSNSGAPPSSNTRRSLATGASRRLRLQPKRRKPPEEARNNNNGEGNAFRRFFRRGRFSLAF